MKQSNNIESNVDSKESLQKANTSTWQEVKLGEVVEIINGYAFKSKHFLTAQEYNSLPIIKIKNVANGDTNLDSVFYHFFEPKLEKFIIHKGDILIALTGNHPSAPSQVVGGVSRYKLTQSALLNQRVAKIVPNKFVSKDFIYYFLKDKKTHNILANQSSGSANQANISKDDIENLAIKLPPLETQRKIAEILSSLDDKIDLLHKQNQSLESLAQTLFEYHFIHNAKAEWEEKPLGEIAEIGIGRTPPRKEKQYFSTNNQDMQWISIKDMGDNGIFILNTAEYLTHEAVEKFNIPIIPKNSVLLSFKMTLGRVAITSCDMLSNEAIAHFKLKQDSIITKEYLYLFLKTFRYETLGSTSSIVTAINSTMIKALLIKIPNVNEIKEFQTKTENLFSKIYQNSKQIESLKSLRDIMLPKLLNGEIGVR